MDTKRIFNKKTAAFLITNGAELIDVRKGEVANKPNWQTFIFKDDEKLSKALRNYRN
ncbi:DUF5659 domain-containing protein [Neobacillus mesonae]|nr:DUF5659 domain-containing protein [Neobacillus mesonae]